MIYAAADEYLYIEQEYSDEIYFIVSGRVSYVLYYKEELYPYKTIPRGSYFGEIEVMKKQPRRYRA